MIDAIVGVIVVSIIAIGLGTGIAYVIKKYCKKINQAETTENNNV